MPSSVKYLSLALESSFNLYIGLIADIYASLSTGIYPALCERNLRASSPKNTALPQFHCIPAPIVAAARGNLGGLRVGDGDRVQISLSADAVGAGPCSKWKAIGRKGFQCRFRPAI